jgi:hypothetical protein
LCFWVDVAVPIKVRINPYFCLKKKIIMRLMNTITLA